jgi:uncharacterized protein
MLPIMQDPKHTAQQLFERFSVSDIEGVLALMTDDVSWRMPGKPELTPTAGFYDKARLRRLFGRMLERLDGPLRMTVLASIGEGDRVAVEVESQGDLRNGRAYRQQYHFLIEFRDGKICTVREYLDTHHAHDIFFRE